MINLHSYLVSNGAIAIGYIVSRIILNISYFKLNISQFQRLKYARYGFFVVILAFFLMPTILSMLPTEYHSNFQFEPFLRSASSSFSEYSRIVSEKFIQIPSQGSHLSIHNFINIFLFLGISFFFARYINNLVILYKIQKESFCQRKINNIHILFSNKCELPFCWGFFKNHFIVIPSSMLERSKDIKLAIRHELQHIRQRDTYWLHFMAVVKSLCFWNPFVRLWINWLDELQEFSCDESIVIRNKVSPAVYAQCLVNVANDMLHHSSMPQGVLGIHGLSKSFLYRRVNMLFNYEKAKIKKISIITAYIVLFFTAISLAFAFNGSTPTSPLSMKQVAAMIKKSHLDKDFQVSATPEVMNEINNIRSSDQARSFVRESLQRMKKYQPVIQEALNKKSMPNDLLVIPLVESGYQPLDQSKNPVLAAGIWQIIPDTAKRLGLVVNKDRDDRLNTQLSTEAAITYLKMNYDQFHNWKLTSIAYEIGEKNTDRLIKETGSRDAWTLASASSAPTSLKKFVAMFDALLIIMHNPSLVD